MYGCALEEGGGWGEKDQRSEERKRVLLSQSRSYKTGNRVNKNLSKNINFQTNLFFLILRRNGGRERREGVGMGEWGEEGREAVGKGERGEEMEEREKDEEQSEYALNIQPHPHPLMGYLIRHYQWDMSLF